TVDYPHIASLGLVAMDRDAFAVRRDIRALIRACRADGFNNLPCAIHPGEHDFLIRAADVTTIDERSAGRIESRPAIGEAVKNVFGQPQGFAEKLQSLGIKGLFQHRAFTLKDKRARRGKYSLDVRSNHALDFLRIQPAYVYSAILARRIPRQVQVVSAVR